MTKKDLYANTKMFLFSRWLATCYADTLIDDISVLNKKNGFWYAEQIKYFNEVVYLNYIKNGMVKDTTEFLNK